MINFVSGLLQVDVFLRFPHVGNFLRVLRFPHGEMYSIHQYVIKFVSELLPVDGFLRFPPPIKLTATI